ncbi:MAG: DUF3164 family protein [Pseudomonas sp.]|nr:DUF3164 family protein [Pseudomonas sp.]
MKEVSGMQVPEGFIFNAQGDLIKESNLSPLQREETKLCQELFPKAQELHHAIALFKHESMHMVEQALERLMNQHKIVKFKKIKGNVQFVSINGLIKIQRAIDDRIEANSISEVARQFISQYQQVVKEGSSRDASQWIDTTFENGNGKLSVSKIVDFMNRDIDHPLYRQAVEALRKSLFVSGTKAYLRFYFRDAADSEWKALPLQFSSIEGINPEEPTEQERPNEKQKEEAVQTAT